jgi:hypothetical protein
VGDRWGLIQKRLSWREAARAKKQSSATAIVSAALDRFFAKPPGSETIAFRQMQKSSADCSALLPLLAERWF